MQSLFKKILFTEFDPTDKSETTQLQFLCEPCYKLFKQELLLLCFMDDVKCQL